MCLWGGVLLDVISGLIGVLGVWLFKIQLHCSCGWVLMLFWLIV